MVDQKKENVATTREAAKTKSEVKILLKEERRWPVQLPPLPLFKQLASLWEMVSPPPLSSCVC